MCIPSGEKTLGHRKGDRHLKDGSGIRNKVASISNKVMGVGNKMAGEIRGTWFQVTGQLREFHFIKCSQPVISKENISQSFSPSG